MNDICNENLDGTMRTYSGNKLSFINPTPDSINIKDISRGLAYKAHFAGQTHHFFSIAQHSMMVADLIPDRLRHDRKFMLLALLHDASEAYTGDIVKPLKVLIPDFVEIEKRIMQAVCTRFEIDYNRLPELKEYDLMAQNIEYRNFYKGEKTIKYLSPAAADIYFRFRFVNLFTDINR